MNLLERLDGGFTPALAERGVCNFIGTALAIGLAAAGAAGSIGGAAIGASAAGKAANTQANAATNAANLQKQAADQALAEQKRQFDIGQSNLAPWLSMGQGGLANLSYLMGLLPPRSTAGQTTTPVAGTTAAVPGVGVPSSTVQDADNLPMQQRDMAGAQRPGLWDINGVNNPQAPPAAAGAPAAGTAGQTVDLSSLVNPNLGAPGSLMQPWSEQFTAPTNVTEQNDPGYQFRLNEGLKALEHSASAKGNLLTGGTAKAEDAYAQNYASNEYGNVYNRALGEYQQKYNIFQQNNTNTFNRLATLSGMGQTTAQQLNSAGQNYANNSSTILTNSAAQQGNALQNAAAARASGYVGSANAWSGALSGGTNNLMQAYLLSQMNQQPGMSSGWTSVPGGSYTQVPYNPSEWGG